jgi:hypothetical protein
METADVPQTVRSTDNYSNRAVRSWWADGFWDLAMAGFWLITAVWLYPLVRTLDFPSWTWPWPFITEESINPMSREITLWIASLFGIWIIYIVSAKLLIDRLKRRFTAPRLGDVRHAFFLPVGRSFGLIFLALYVAGCAALVGLFWTVKGGPHFFSAIGIASFGGILFLLGKRFDIPRYLWLAGVGTASCILVELLTTRADYQLGPRNFFDVSPLLGNPSLVCLIWAALLVAGGILTVRNVLRLPNAEA